ncbi:MAG: hypothetical protein IPI49_13905 [Myxococcales bacterium]|nr:hypothetical protein [Myxococcales bacterium]
MTASSDPKPQPTDEETTLSSWAIVLAIAVIALNGLFQVASPPEYREQARISFLIFTVLVGGALFAAAARPRLVGHALAGGMGLAALGAGLANLASTLPFLLALVLVVIGLAMLWMAYRSLTTNSRLSWAFLAALLGVLAVCTLFGAPKIRNLLHVSMWTALLLPGLSTVATIALSMISEDYRVRVTPRR